MSGRYGPIRSDCRRILLTVPSLPDVAWEGRAYKPSAGVPYVREQMDPVSTSTSTLGQTGSNEERFLYRLDVFQPKITSGGGTFITELEALVDDIRAAFHHGRGISSVSPPQYGTVIATSRRPIVEGEVFDQVPIVVEAFFRAAR